MAIFNSKLLNYQRVHHALYCSKLDTAKSPEKSQRFGFSRHRHRCRGWPRRISTGQKANPVAWGLDYESFFFTSRLGIETCGALSTSWFHMEEITTSHG